MLPDVTLILPAFNEAATIQNTIQEAVAYFDSRGLRHEIIVAADGDDGTRELVEKMSRKNPALRVIGDRARLGKGQGVRLAMTLASGAIVGYADADNKVPIQEFDKVHPWFASGFDLVVGSRALEQSQILRWQPLYRRLGARAFAFVMRTITGVRSIRDTQCGFKFFRKEAADHVFRYQRIDGYMFDVEVLALSEAFGYRIKEVPIQWRDDGDSRLELVRGNLRNGIDLFRIRASLGRLDQTIERSVAASAKMSM